MKHTVYDYLKFILLSMMGIFLFFVPVNSQVVIVIIVNFIKSILKPIIPEIILISSLALICTLLLAKIFKNKSCEKYHKDDSKIKQCFFISSLVIVLLVYFKAPLGFVCHPEIGGKIFDLASTIMMTIAVAGWLVIFILKSGLVEFVSVLVEPIMRPLFKLPGEAAVNIVSSFVSSASIGVYLTDQYYQNKVYTTKEAASVVVNYSVISVGYIGVLVSLANIPETYGLVLISSFILVLIMGIIMIRIPPLSRMSNLYIDKSDQKIEVNSMSFKERFHRAIESGLNQSKTFNIQAFISSLCNALKFSQKIIAVMITTVTIVLCLVYYTPIFKYLGIPFIPLLNLLQIPDASSIAPSVLIGFVEVSLPTISISALTIAKQSAFFVVMLSIVQVIFMTEAGNAILSSKIPLNFKDLVIIFIVRTLVAMPLIALLSHIIY